MRDDLSKKQGGVILLEALIAIVIFSFGILGMVSLQANAIKQAGDAKMRSDASYLADQMISQMWIDRSNLADYIHFSTTVSDCHFSGTASTSANVTNWLGSTSTLEPGTVNALPNASAQIQAEPGTGLVTVTICWRAPQETAVHNFTSTALISG